MMPPSHNYNTRSSAKRKRVDNQEDEPRAPKAQKTNPKPSCKISPAAERAERARRAERKKLARVMRVRGPEDEIDETELASNGSRPEVRLYGWPFKYEHMLEYAKRHHLHAPLAEGARKWFGGKKEVDFADLAEEHSRSRRSRIRVEHAAMVATVRRLSELAGTPLKVARPYSLDWDGLVYIYSNYDIEERCETLETLGLFDRVVDVMDEAMNEEWKGERSKLQWWYTFSDIRPWEDS